ncbi:MAG: hypothetical protein ACRDGE_05045 [Candidatus Limnocylindria bacterium]
MRQLRTILLALALVLAVGGTTAAPAEAGWLTRTVASVGDLLNLTWE